MEAITCYSLKMWLMKLFSCVVGTAGSVASQLVAGDKIRLDPVLAFGLYG